MGSTNMAKEKVTMQSNNEMGPAAIISSRTIWSSVTESWGEYNEESSKTEYFAV